MTEVNVDGRHGEVFTQSDGELHDEATPLPDDDRKASAGDDDRCILRSPVCDVGGVAVTMRRSPKDKRNMREKRRSTGRVSYNDEQSSPVIDDGDDAVADDETDRNTSYNETPVASADRRTSTTASGTTDDSGVSQCPTSTSGQAGVGTSLAPPPVSLSTAAATSTNRSSDAPAAVRPAAPVVPPKPKVCPQPAGTGRSPWQTRPPNEKASTTAGQEDHLALLARVHTLEKVVHEANTENFRLKEMLLMRENRIAELETEVEALNKDLDLADEDYEKMEEKNAALVRVVAQLSPR